MKARKRRRRGPLLSTIRPHSGAVRYTPTWKDVRCLVDGCDEDALLPARAMMLSCVWVIRSRAPS